jgi:hypothetical protein
MREILVRFAFLAALVLAPSAAHADDQVTGGVPCTPFEVIVTGTCYSWWPDIPDEPLCSDYVTSWVRMAKLAQARGCSPGGPMWSTVVTVQGDYCLSAGTDANNARTAEMERVMSVCDACSNAVDGVMHDIVDNALYSCGFSNSDGRWSASRESQINRCVTAQTLLTRVGREGYKNANAQMDEQVRVCKQTHVNKNCVSCHDSSSSAAVQAMPRGGNTLRESLQQLPKRPKLNAADIVVDPCTPGVRGATFPCKQPASKVIEPGMLEGGNDLPRQGPGATGNPGANAPAASPLFRR